MQEPELEYLRGLRVMREDPEWMNKLMVGSALLLSSMIIPILGQVVVLGWCGLIMRRAVLGANAPLPELRFDLDYLGKLASIGFKGFIVSFVWMLPLYVLGGGSYICMVGSMFAGLESMGRGGGDPGPMFPIMIGVFMLVFFPLALVLGMFSRVAAIRAELTDDLNSGLKFGEVTQMAKSMFGDLIKGMFVLGFVSVPIALLGELACCIGVFFSMMVIQVMSAHFGAQAYLRYVARGGTPLPIAPEPVGAGGAAPPPAAAPF